MDASEERKLYLTDREAWYQQAAPRIAERLRTASEEEKMRMWCLCSDRLKTILRTYAKASHSKANP